MHARTTYAPHGRGSHVLKTLRAFAISGVLAAALAAAGTATACIEVGVYRDRPQATLGQLDRTVGTGVSVISTYVTVGRRVDPAVIAVARRRRSTLLVTLMVDNGRDRPSQPAFTNGRVAAGRYDRHVRELARQLKSTGLRVIVRPMPEPNTPWYAWSGTVNGNSASSYVRAFRRVRNVLRRNGGTRLRVLWAPYARSIPDTDANALDRYFPGNASVDMVGTSGYNFGRIGALGWLHPLELFQDPYIQIQALSKKPFWIAETGSTARGGSKPVWLRNLARLQRSMPRLRGIVLYDVREASGDFRITGTSALRAATRALLATRCARGA